MNAEVNPKVAVVLVVVVVVLLGVFLYRKTSPPTFSNGDQGIHFELKKAPNTSNP